MRRLVFVEPTADDEPADLSMAMYVVTRDEINGVSRLALARKGNGRHVSLLDPLGGRFYPYRMVDVEASCR